MSYEALKKQVFDSNMKLVEHGLVILTWGNVSGIDRERGVVAIKPRGIEYHALEPGDIPVVDLQGNQVDGTLKPSVDLDIHLEIYRSCPDVGGIAHTHSPFATAWAHTCQSIPVFGTTHADHFYGDIPCTRRLTPEEVTDDYEANIGKSIIEAFQGMDIMQIPGVLAAGHGPFTWGKNPEESVEMSLILEELAKMAKLTLDIAPESPQLDKHMLDKHYLRKYGPNAYFYQKKE